MQPDGRLEQQGAGALRLQTIRGGTNFLMPIVLTLNARCAEVVVAEILS